MSKIIGIDLGTTFSCVSVMEGSTPKVITNSSGSRTTPSVIGFTDKGEKVVGQIARHQQTTNPENTVFSVKRFMGRRHNEVGDEEKTVPYKVVGGSNDPVSIEIKGKTYTPPELSAIILQELKKSAEDYLGQKVDAAVITVPAYFNDAQRKATQEAGIIAGFDVKRVLPEPTAAALAYGMDKNKSGKIAVFDLGGGTFDVSVLDVGEGLYETLSISGDTHLGGDDYDEALIKYVVAEFKKQEGIDISTDPMAFQRLKEACEKAKCELSTSMEAQVSLPFITADANGPKHLQVSLTRTKFEQITEHLLKRLRKPVMQALKDAKLSADPTKLSEEVECILVGGSTRIPAVQNLCKEIFGKEPNRSINPDEAVALGAAIQAGIIGGEVSEMVVLDVTPLSLGVETMGNVLTTMIPRNTTIPTSKTETYSTAADNQNAVTIHVLQGERPMAVDNRSLGRFNLEGIPPAPRGIPQIEVVFDIDTNGILNVTAKDKGTNKEQNIRIEGSSGLSEEQIDKMKKEAEEHAEEDVKRKETIDARNQADALIHQAEKSIKEYGEKLSSEDLGKIEATVNSLKDAVKSDDAEVIKKASEEVSTSLQAIGKIMYEEAQKSGEGVPGSPDIDAAVKQAMDEADKKDADSNVVDAEVIADEQQD